MTEPHPGSDMKAAFLGLVVGTIVLVAIIVTIVRLTNASYAHEKHGATGLAHPTAQARVG